MPLRRKSALLIPLSRPRLLPHLDPFSRRPRPAHGEGADITTDITEHNVRVDIARHILNRFGVPWVFLGQRATTAATTGVGWDLNEAMNVEHFFAETGSQPL